MATGNATIIWNDEQWNIYFYHSPGTKYFIHSASLEPNDPEEFEVEEFGHESLSDDFCEWLFSEHKEEIELEAYTQIVQS